MVNMTHEEVTKAIRQWAIDRGLHDGSDPSLQMEKLLEEVGELSKAIALFEKAQAQLDAVAGYGDSFKHEESVALAKRDEALKMFIDAIGDVRVVTNVMALQYGVDVEVCDAHAYGQIKDRKGKMVNGVFVKE